MKKLIINKIFFKNYLNYKIEKFDLQKAFIRNYDSASLKYFKNLPANVETSYNFKNLIIKPYLLNKILKLKKINSFVNLLIKDSFLNYKISMFFSTRKFPKKFLVKN